MGAPTRIASMNALWMLVASVLFSVMGACVKFAGRHYGVTEILFYRSLIGAACLFAFVHFRGMSLSTPLAGLHLRRGVVGTAAGFLWFYATTVLPLGSEFGWEVTRGDRDHSFADLVQLLTQAGIRWVKLPVWFSVQDDDIRLVQFRSFADRLAAYGIEIVGILCDPPKQVRDHFRDLKSPTAADVFGAPPETWAAPLEPVMTSLAGQVRWWQLGHDRDTSFVGYPNLLGKMEQVKASLTRVGRSVNLGMGWGWLNQFPPTPDDRAPWQFLSLSADPSIP